MVPVEVERGRGRKGGGLAGESKEIWTLFPSIRRPNSSMMVWSVVSGQGK
jgi:hypothetical protein